MNGESFQKNQEDLNKVVTLGVLLEYTDEFLMPKMQEMVTDAVSGAIAQSEHRMTDTINGAIAKSEQRTTDTINGAIAKSENRLMDYIDRRLTDSTAELFKKLEQKFQTERQFKDKVVELFKRHNIGTSEDLAFLDGLVKGGW